MREVYSVEGLAELKQSPHNQNTTALTSLNSSYF